MNDLIQIYCDYVKDNIDEKGVFPTPMMARTSGRVEFYAMMVVGAAIINKAFVNCARPEIVEQIVGLDSYTAPDQGTTFDSAVILFYLRRGEPTRIGVLEYSWNEGQPIAKPIDWDNAFWNKQYKMLAKQFDGAFAALA